MRVGVFADTHDHLDNIRLAVAEFNRRECELVLFAGDLVSTFAIPPLRELNCPMLACFGDNEGNRVGIRGGMEIVGEIADPPVGFQIADGTKILMTHQLELLRGAYGRAEVVIFAHTHRPSISRDEEGRLFLNPGETSGWSFGQPSIMLLDTATRDAQLIPLR